MKEVIKAAELMHDYVFRYHEEYSNLEICLEEMGIEVYYADIPNADGYLRFNMETKKPRIVLKAYQADTRQRFTMAHELGHLILHQGWTPNNNKKLPEEILEVTMYRGNSATPIEEKPREKQANEFAGVFLMPRKKVLKLLQELKEKTGKNFNPSLAAKAMAKEFNVSLPAAQIRLKRLLEG